MSTIKVRRTQLDLTQGELAEKLGVSQNMICNWENGRNVPQHHIEKLHNVLGAGIDLPNTTRSRGNYGSISIPASIRERFADSSTLLIEKALKLYSMVEGKKVTIHNSDGTTQDLVIL